MILTNGFTFYDVFFKLFLKKMVNPLTFILTFYEKKLLECRNCNRYKCNTPFRDPIGFQDVRLTKKGYSLNYIPKAALL